MSTFRSILTVCLALSSCTVDKSDCAPETENLYTCMLIADSTPSTEHMDISIEGTVTDLGDGEFIYSYSLFSRAF